MTYEEAMQELIEMQQEENEREEEEIIVIDARGVGDGL